MRLKSPKKLTKKDIKIRIIKAEIGLKEFNSKVNITSAETFKKIILWNVAKKCFYKFKRNF